MDMPKQIGQYRIVHLLGTGGMGEVYLAHDDKLDRPRAIKRLVPKGKNAEQQRERFRREARITARLEHPSIVRVFDVFDEGEATCIVMEYVPGPTLRQRIVEGGPLSVRETLRIGLQIADGMAKAHREGVIHRDLKSENVLLHLDGTARVTDFGIAKELGAQTLTEQGKLLGTYTAMSPEQIRGEELRPASDLFSFGILLYEALTGERPFTGRGLEQIVLAITQHQQPPLSTRIPGLPERLSALVDSLLLKHWSMRPASFRDVIDDLKRIEAALDDAEAALKVPSAATSSIGEESTEDPDALAANVAEPAHVATPVDPGRAIVLHPVQGATDQQHAPAEPGSSATGRASRRRWLPGVFAGMGVILAVTMAYGLWPREIDRPVPAPMPVPRVERRIAVLEPAVSKDCPHGRDWVTNTVRNAMEEPLFRFQGVFVVSEIGALARAELATAVADELLGATVSCHPGHLTIELRRQDAKGNLLVPRRSFEIDISQLGRSDIIQNNVLQLYEGFETRPDALPRGEARPQDLDEFQRLTKGYWTSELSLEEVLGELEGIRRSSPAFLDAYILASELLMHRADPGDFDNAWQIMQEAKAIDPDWHPVLSRLFTIALARHDIDAAEAILQEIEAFDQGAGFTYYLQGLLREDAQDTQGARDAMQTAAKRHPSWPILYHLANLNMAVCDIQGAQQVLDELLTGWPNNRSARTLKWKLVGRIDPRAAAEQYEPLPLPREPAESFNQAVNLTTIGRYREAKSLILETMEQHTDRRDDLGATYSLAELEKLLGETESAQARFAQVLRQVPADEHRADVMVARAMVLAHQGRFEDARQAIESALRREDMEIYYSAAAVYALAGDATEAARWAERALACGYAPEWFHYPWFDTIRQMPQLRERIGKVDNSPAR